MRILAQLLTEITGKPRHRLEKVWWRSDSIVHNIFMLWKIIFWEIDGIRFEMGVSVNPDGTTIRRYGTFEAFLFDIEESVKSLRFRFPIKIHVPMLNMGNGIAIPASPYLFAIAFDAAAAVANTTNPSTSITVGSGASNYIGWVNLMPTGGSRSSSGTTWGGASMTQVFDSNESINGANGHFYALYKTSISSGSTTVTSTTTANYYLDIMSFSGVDQSTPLDTNFDGASGNYVRATQTGSTSFTFSGTSHIDNSRGVGLGVNDGTGYSAGTNTTKSNNHSFYNTANITPAGTTSLVLTNGVAPPNWLGFVSGLQPSTGGGATTKRSLMMTGLGQ